MPFSFKKKGIRREISREVILLAIQEVADGAKIQSTAKKYDIPRTNLKRYITEGSVKDNSTKFISSQIFTNQEEAKLSEYLKISSKLHYGMSKVQARKLAFDYATAIKKKIPDNWVKNNIASKDWVRGFLKRNQDLAIRTPEATSLSRATSFNRKNVGEFFENLRDVYGRYHFGPESIYNIDETGLTTVQRTQKVIAPKGSKQVGQATSAERGSLVTVCCGVNAVGNSIPPYFIFPRVNFKTYMLNDAPIGADGSAHTSGWMTSSNFLKYMHHFVKHAKPTPSSPVLLLLDNHESHISVEVLNFCKESGIIMLTFPPHCSHRLQPLDLTVYGPLKNYYNKAVTDWMLCNAGKTVTIYDIPKLATIAIPQALKPQNIQRGFEKPGIWPFNSNAFSDEDFMCSSVSDREMPVAGNVIVDQTTPNKVSTVLAALENAPNETQITEQHLTVEISATHSDNEAVPGPSQFVFPNRDPIQAAVIIIPEMVRPYPKAGARKQSGMKRKKGSTRILTDTPEKRQIEIAEQEKLRKITMKADKRKKKDMKNIEKKKIEKLTSRKRHEREISSSDSEADAILLADSSEGSFLIETSDEENFDEDDVIVLDRKFMINDFVLVKFDTKKGVIHYVGRIEELCHSMATIKFMRQSKLRNTFMYPNIDDIASVPLNDIKTKLPEPTTCTKSKRGSSKYTFSKPLWVIPNLR